MAREFDVVVVGAGPVGAAAALGFARKGAHVALVEGNPAASHRFAGEWVHPPGVAVLDRFRAGRFEGASPRTGYGFAVFPDDGGEHVELPYPDGGVAVVCEHGSMVDQLRENARAHARVTYLPHCRVQSIRTRGDDEGEVTLDDRQRNQRQTLRAGLIVGADGRNSIVRKSMGLEKSSVLLSYMASVELPDADLPVEGFGHLILGGPGPAILYRIGQRRIRACLDVPLHLGAEARTPAFLEGAFIPVLPKELVQGMRRGLREGPVPWAANRYRPRAHYRKGCMALIGDAAGHSHPMTAVGITMGLLDAERLVEDVGNKTTSNNKGDLRERESYVPELLASALYEVFTQRSPSATAIRRAVFERWRDSGATRANTMRLLTGAENRGSRFGSTFTRIAVNALGSSLREVGRKTAPKLTEEAHGSARHQFEELAQLAREYGAWASFPVAALLPDRLRRRWRDHAIHGQPLAAVAEIAQAAAGSRPDAPTAATPKAQPKATSNHAKPVRRNEMMGAQDRGNRDASKTPTTGGNGAARARAHDANPSLEADWQYCQSALVEVSRTFALPIALLPDNLRRAVTCGYLLCRTVDTVEDLPNLSQNEREELFSSFLALAEGKTDGEELAQQFARMEGADPDLDLGRNLPRVMRAFETAEPEARKACRRWVTEMARGMHLYAHRPANADGYHTLETVQDLERYCYFVAGTVGHMLTDMFLEELGDRISEERALALRSRAESFGTGLQLVNILKDVTDDRQRGWCFIPRTCCDEHGLTPKTLTDEEHRPSAHAAVAPLFHLARTRLDMALEYSLTIPAGSKGIRLFCLLPLWMAARTLALARNDDRMFNEGEPVKISRADVEQVVSDCGMHYADDDWLRREYLALWQPQPDSPRSTGSSSNGTGVHASSSSDS